MSRIEKFYLDYRTHRDIAGGGFWRALRFAFSNPQFPKWEDFKNGKV